MSGFSSAHALIERERRRGAVVVDLARHLAIAVRVEPALLRAMRVRLFRSATVAVESDLWFSPLVQVRDPEAIVLRPDVREALLDDLRHPAGAAARDNAWTVIRAVHGGGPPVMRLEEHATYLALAGRISEMERVLGGALDALVEDSTGGFARWAARSLPRMPREARQSAPALALARAASERLGPITVRGVLAADEAQADWSTEMLRSLPRVTVHARILAVSGSGRSVSGKLELDGERPSQPNSPDAQIVSAMLALPATKPLVVDVLTPDETGWREHRLSFERGARVNLPISVGPAIKLRSLVGEVVRIKPEASSRESVLPLELRTGDRLALVAATGAARDLGWSVLESTEEIQTVGTTARGRDVAERIKSWADDRTDAELLRLTRSLLVSEDEAAFADWFARATSTIRRVPPEIPGDPVFGRDDVVAAVGEFCTADAEASILIVSGEAGVGKSAVLREFARSHRLPLTDVVYRLVESEISEDDLGAELAALVPGAEDLDPDNERLPGRDRLKHLLTLASAAGSISPTLQLVMVVDGLDGPDKDVDPFVQLLRVLPARISPGLRIVTSSREVQRTTWPAGRDGPVRTLDLDEARWQASNAEVVSEFWKRSPLSPNFRSQETLNDAIRLSNANMRVAEILHRLLTLRPRDVSLGDRQSGLRGVVELVRHLVDELPSVSRGEAHNVLRILTVARRPMPIEELAPGYIDQPGSAIRRALEPLLKSAPDGDAKPGPGPGYMTLVDRTSVGAAIAAVFPEMTPARAHDETVETLRRFVKGRESSVSERERPYVDWARRYLRAFTLRHLAGAGRIPELDAYCANAQNVIEPIVELGFDRGRRELAETGAGRQTNHVPEPFATYLRIIDGQAHWIRRDPAALPGILWTQLIIEGHDLENASIARSYGLDDIQLTIRLLRPLGRLPATASDPPVLEGHLSSIAACAIADRAPRAASASRDGSVRIWDLGTGREVNAPHRHWDALTAVAISADGASVGAAGAADGSVFRWRLDDPDLDWRWTSSNAHAGAVTACVLGEADIFTGGEDGTVRAFGLTRTTTWRVLSWKHPVKACFVIGAEIAAVYADGLVQVAVIRSGKLAREFNLNRPVGFSALRRHQSVIVAIHPDGKQSVLDLRSGDVSLSDWSRGELSVSAFAESGEAGFAATAFGRRLILRPLSTAGSAPERELLGQREPVRSLAFGTVGQTPVLLSASEDGTLTLWDCARRREVLTLGMIGSASHLMAAGTVAGFAGIPVDTPAAATTGTRVLAFPVSPTKLAVHDIDRSVELFQREFDAPVFACTVTAGNRLTVVLRDGQAYFVRGSDADLRVVNGSLTGGRGLTAFAAHDQTVIAGGSDGRLGFWRSQAPEFEPLRVEGHDGIVRCIAIDQSGELAATVGDDGAVLLWNASEARVLRRLAESEAPDRVCVFSPDGQSVVVGSATGAVESFKVQENVASMLEGCDAGVNALVFKEHADGLRVIAASDDAALRVIGFGSGLGLGWLRGHTRPVIGCASVPTEGLVVSWSLDRTVKLWNIDTFECVGTIHGHAPFVALRVMDAADPLRHRATVGPGGGLVGTGGGLVGPPRPTAAPRLVALDAAGMVWVLEVSERALRRIEPPENTPPHPTLS